MKKFFNLDFLPVSADLGILVLRFWLGLTLLLMHGWSKLSGFSQMSRHFPDPLGITSRGSLGLAVFADVVCAGLLVIGFFTRFSALVLAINMGVAFTMVHHLSLKAGPGSGELAFMYLAGFVTLLCTGGGRFALDGKKGGSKSAAAPPKKPSPPKQ